VVTSSTRARQPAAAVAASPGVGGAGDGCIAGVIGRVKARFSSRLCRRGGG
jgi:hypothetical protein